MKRISENRIVSLVFRLLAFGLVYAGLIVVCFSNGSFYPDRLFYYTILSNLLVLALFPILIGFTILDLIKSGIKGPTSYVEKFSFVVLIDILLTFFVFWLILAPTSFSMGNGNILWTFENLSVHAVAPLLVVLDYFVFTKAKKMRFRNIFLTWIFPLAYVAMVFIVGLSGYSYYDGAHYPYIFLDIDKMGALVVLWVALLLLFFTGLATGFYFLDRWRHKRNQKSLKNGGKYES